MSSLRELVVVSFTSLLLFGSSSAKPLPTRRAASPCLNLPTDVVFPSTLPLTAGPSSLPEPPANLALKHVTIGHGIQNYTCSANLSAAPVPLGAIATLYDVTPLAFLSAGTASQIPAIAAYQPLTSSLIPQAPLSISGQSSFPIIGYHYFSSNGTPVFDLTATREILLSKKVADIKAPSDATVGLLGTGAVDWLSLTAVPGGGSVGLQQVYRVDTAGGNPPKTCEGFEEGDVVSVPYSAGYHFYG